MSYGKMLRKLFQGTELRVEDFLLLEAYQIASLKDRAPARELAAVLLEHPDIRYFFVHKYPPIMEFIEHAIDTFGPAVNEKEYETCCDTLVWELAELIVYNKHPGLLDSAVDLGWSIDDIQSVSSLKNKVVIDAGAGTGRVAFEVVTDAGMVFAVEPCASLRKFIIEKGREKGIPNLFVLDGFLHAIPLPKGFADVLITSNAIGWNLDDELKEIERVVKTGGYAIHLLSSSDTHDPYKERLTNPQWHYTYTEYEKDERIIRKYWKHIA